MVEIFFSIVTDTCFISLFNQKRLVSNLEIRNHSFHSDNFIKNLNSLVSENNFSLSDLRKVYFISGPGEQTGIRVTSSFVTALSMLSREVKFFSVDGLFFQKGNEDNCLSIITIGKNTKRYLVKLYEKNELVFSKEIFKSEEIDDIKNKRKGLKVLSNFKETNFIENFLLLKEKFYEVEF